MSGDYTLVTSSATFDENDDTRYMEVSVSPPDGMIALSGGWNFATGFPDDDPQATYFVPASSWPKYSGLLWSFTFIRQGIVPVKDYTIDVFAWCDDAPEDLDLTAARAAMAADTKASAAKA